jgi:ubiquinone/menaquinone biosynthesis C-methylase UbiE
MIEKGKEQAMAEEENTYIFDTESAVEMARLINQERVITTAMGGPLSGVPELPPQAQVLDLGCGPGGWALDVAFARPDAEVAGVDISKTMIGYANARARSQVLRNVSFGVMDIRQPLDFSNETFDLVNARFLVVALKRENWEPFLAECSRVLKPGGIVRFTEPVDFGITNSVICERLMALLAQALWKSGYGFSVDGRTYAMTTTLPGLFRAAGYRQVHAQAHVIEFSAGQPAWQEVYDDYQAAARDAPALFVKAGLATEEEMVQLSQQFLLEMRSPDFRAMWHLVTVLGTRPSEPEASKR